MSKHNRTQAGPDASAAERGLKAALPWLACSAVSGGLLFASFPPVERGLLAYVALAPLALAAVRARSHALAALCGAVAATAACLPAFAWVASVTVPGWLGLAVYVGLYVVAWAVGVRLLRGRFPGSWPLMAAVLWVALELTRARLGPGFPWLFVGYTQYRFGALVQLAAVGGVYALSFVVVLVSTCAAALVDGLLGPRPGMSARRAVALAASLALVGLCCWLGGRVRARLPVSEGPVVGVVQQNLPRLVEEVFDPDKTVEEVYQERADEVQLCAQLTARLRDSGARLVVWPESTVPVPLDIPARFFAVERERRLQEQALGYFRQLGREMGSYFLVGAPAYVSREAARSLLYGVEATVEFGNSAVLISPEGEFVERYDKMRLVPFGEYIPLRDALPFLQFFTPIPRGISPGTEPVVFSVPLGEGKEPLRFGALVCYEGVFPDLCAEFRRRGAEALVNVTDEGWYYVPGELRQHLAMDVFRAVETRTTLVRAANTGISCFIGPRGEVYAELPPLTEDALSASLRLSTVLTPYARFGDVFAVACLMVAIALPALCAALRGRDPA
jgi:apolipoprotein N-acyltransferase